MAPNPTSESVTLNYNNSSDVAYKALVEVIDVQGRTVLSVIDGEDAFSITNGVRCIICAEGIYFVKLTLSNGKSVFQN
ncbi:MAG: T9SS type A sorting domain-containing protein [Sphingobacteriales bacterium]|nr:T9SS type A sorting domain-containing protein [Sphingobacteriales bacterium]